MDAFLNGFAQADPETYYVFIGFLRVAAPVFAFLLLLRCAKPLLTFRREPEIWAWLCLPGDQKLPLTHWENVVGRSKRSDVVVDFPTVSRNHCVFTRYDDGSWTVSDAASKDGVYVNGKRVSICALEPEDTITIGGIDMTLLPISARQEARLAELRTPAASPASGVANLLILTVFQLCCMMAFLLSRTSHPTEVFWGFAGLTMAEWVLFIFYLCIRRPSFEVETLAFFLCTMGMAALSTVAPGEIKKQLLAVILGIGVFLAVGWSLRDLERAKRFRYLASVAGVGLLLITLVFGQEIYGAKNWLYIGSFSVQPSELSKVCFVFVGASTMDRLMNKRNLILFIGYSAFICGCLALMNDFGTALIFFCAFLVIAFLRSGSVGTVALAIAALVFAGVVALKIAPHALRRFTSWRHIWEDPLDTGYQQTRALMCLASGGLLGLGAGRGWMVNVFAADSDMVFATISEEWGLLMAIMVVLCVVILGLFSVRSTAVSRSSFYTIGSCTAASILLVQTMLNVLGTVDVLPLTGVTLPFVSNGGSSMLCVWGLLAFVKAADTRQNASFAVRLSPKEADSDE